MKITYPNHPERVLVRTTRVVGWLLERAVTITGWVIVVLVNVVVVALLTRVIWSFVILTLKAIGEI